MTASALPLADFLTRLRDFLMDANQVKFDDDTLTEALRQASSDLGRVYGEFVTIEDLDAALATTVDELDADLVIRGAAGYAARSYAVDRAGSANLGQSMPADLLEWSKNIIYYFDQALTQVKLRRLQQSTSNPASPWTWDETHKNW